MQRWIEGLRPYTLRVVSSLTSLTKIAHVVRADGHRTTARLARCPRDAFRKLTRVLGPHISGIRVYAKNKKDDLLHEVPRPQRCPTLMEIKASKVYARQHWLQ